MRDTTLQSQTAQVFAQQVLFLLIFSGIAWWFWSLLYAQGVAFGGAVAALNTLMLGSRLQGLPEDPLRAQAKVMGGAVQRFVFTLLALGAGMIWLHLPPLAMIVGMLSGHLVFAGYAILLKKR